MRVRVYVCVSECGDCTQKQSATFLALQHRRERITHAPHSAGGAVHARPPPPKKDRAAATAALNRGTQRGCTHKKPCMCVCRWVGMCVVCACRGWVCVRVTN